MRWFDLSAYNAALKQAWSPNQQCWYFVVDAPASQADRRRLDAALEGAFTVHRWGYIAPRSAANAKRLMQLERAAPVQVEADAVTMGRARHAHTDAGPSSAPASDDGHHGGESDGDRAGTSGPVRPDGGEELGADPADDGAQIGERGPAPGGARGGGSDSLAADGDGHRPGDAAGARDSELSGDGTGPGAGADERGGDHSGEPNPARRGGRRVTPTAEPANPEHFRLGETVDREAGYEPSKRFNENRAAIEVLQTLQAEQRPADDNERATLSRYNGWGGLAKIFDRPFNQEPWQQQARQWLEAHLTPDQLEAVRASTLNSHYTTPDVARAIWDHVRGLGFDGGRVLEPAAGIGYFLGLAPDDIVANSRFTAVENDPIAGPMLATLYPDADVRVGGFESQTDLPNGGFDLVIGNVPFGDYRLDDADYPNESVHNQFLLRSLDKLKPGGIMAVLTSSHTMDARRTHARKLLDRKASLAGAVRLPENAFKAQAGTEVTTDLLVFVRRDSRPRVDAGAPVWMKATTTHRLPHAPGEAQARPRGIEHAGVLNQYWFEHPEMITTELAVGRGGYGRMRFIAQASEAPAEALREALGHITVPEDVAHRRSDESVQVEAEPVERMQVTVAGSRREPGALVFDEDGQIARVVDVHRRQGGEVVLELASTGLSGKQAKRAMGVVGLRDALDAVFRTQIEAAGEDERSGAREVLNSRYERFVAEFGYLHTTANRRVLSGTPDSGRLLALEHWDAKNAVATKADVFVQDIIDPTPPPLSAQTPFEALGQVLNQTGEVSERLIGRALGRDDVDDIMRELAQQGHVFHDPQAGDWVTASAYCSGNVRDKLRIARDRAAHDGFYQRNVEALESVVPADLKPHEIDVRIGAPWLTEATIADFLAETLGSRPDNVRVYHSPYDGRWTVNAEAVANTPAARFEWGTQRRNAVNLVERMLNGASLDVYDTSADNKRVYNARASAAAHDKAAALQQRFEQWLWHDDQQRC